MIDCYGDYERAFIRRMRADVRRKKLVDKILASLVNVLSLVYAHFYFPTYSNGLKEIGGYLGHVWTEPNASAAQSIAWRVWWCRTHDDGWKAKLITYNFEDCAALGTVLELLGRVSAEASASPDLARSDGTRLQISRVRELQQLAYPTRWNGNQFVHPDYKFERPLLLRLSAAKGFRPHKQEAEKEDQKTRFAAKPPSSRPMGQGSELRLTTSKKGTTRPSFDADPGFRSQVQRG